MGSIEQPEASYVDVLIIGAKLMGVTRSAGFGAFTVLNRVRRQGFSVTIYEKGSSSGGTRVDSESPIYQLFDRELYMDFNFKERYSAWPELRRYFKYVDEKWNISEYTKYNKYVETALWDNDKNMWWVECSDGTQTYCRWLIPCLGFASKHYRPPFPGLGNFAGQMYHTAFWPQYGVNLRGKKVALIGTGASGIQVAQEIGDVTKQLTVFQRTPNLALPMQNWNIDPAEEQKKKEAGEYDKIFDKCRWTYTGFHYDFSTKDTKDDTPEDREKFYQSLFDDRGGFRYLLENYKDMLKDEWANDQAYDFWKRSVRARLKDPHKQKVLAPDVKPHPFGTKRNSLEIRFYEVMDQEHVDVIDVNENPIEEVKAEGIKTKEKFVEADVLVLATGFDSVTGSLNQLNIRGTDGRSIAEYWEDGTKTSMGIAIPTFPVRITRSAVLRSSNLSGKRTVLTTPGEYVLPLRRASAYGILQWTIMHSVPG
ncbi:hypothetical protein LTR37_005090 [Vermiconidia calcicola]|uniref:Uncharacterized protein n=1 Tax=Vermiconidia calcicola TaxID=1690605 RepID=A0ACC3NKU4_9PEZI|nr:hypothetical protein LTR37_005090 [Vermiconidia calcicola]